MKINTKKTFFQKVMDVLHVNGLIILSFLSVILAGTFFLMLPVSLQGKPITFIQALFTSTSATCVTGLSVVDTGTTFSTFGQVVLVLLMQTGGLGLMTISTFFLFFLGKKISIRQTLVLQETISQGPMGGFGSILRSILILVFSLEAIGAILLFLVFSRQYPLHQAAWLSVFHSVSGFCNAGLSLFPDNLNRYSSDILVNVTMMGLIICGGIGFLVLKELKVKAKVLFSGKKTGQLTFNTKIVLIMTSFLILSGFLMIYILESNRAFSGMPLREKVLISLFQSVTPRTAGFNTITTNVLSEPTDMVLIFLMFVGGASGSTAGGIKVGTLFILICYVLASLQGGSIVQVFKRKIPDHVVKNATMIIILSLLVLASAVFFISALSPAAFTGLNGRSQFLSIVFECFSAMGTVGLSLGATGNLTDITSLVIIFLMYIGRVGPLLLALSIFPRKQAADFEYPEENIMIG